MRTPNPNLRRGFTIIELLVAVSITVVMVGLMLTVVTNTLNVWNRTTGDLSAENQARQVLDMLARDLQSAVLRADNNVWLAATVQTSGGDSGMSSESWTGAKPTTGSLSLDPARGRVGDVFEDARFGQAGMWLRLFTSSRESGSDTSTAPRAVSYQIIRRQTTSSGPFAYQLFRSAVTHQNTFNAGYDLFMATSPTPSYNEGPANAGVASTIRKPTTTYLLANNVIDFGVRFSLADTAGTVLFPKLGDDLGFAATSSSTKLPPIPSGAGYTTTNVRRGFPQVADVYLRILTPEGARLLAALEDSSTGVTGDWWTIALQNSQVFTRRILIAARPL